MSFHTSPVDYECVHVAIERLVICVRTFDSEFRRWFGWAPLSVRRGYARQPNTIVSSQMVLVYHLNGGDWTADQMPRRRFIFMGNSN